MSAVSLNLAGVNELMSNACARVGRSAESVQLVAVSKTFSSALVREAAAAGQLDFGESKVQEAEGKIAELPENLRWHFIGRVQRNKVRKILQSFHVIHAIDSFRIASHVNEVARELGLFPSVFLQVNIGDEVSKGGYEMNSLRMEMESLRTLDRLVVKGLMSIPPIGPNAEASRRWFIALREMRDSLETEFGVGLPCLSMGMSGDFEVAIEEGATHVRVGSAIFGGRSYEVDAGIK